MAEEEDDDPY